MTNTCLNLSISAKPIILWNNGIVINYGGSIGKNLDKYKFKFGSKLSTLNQDQNQNQNFVVVFNWYIIFF